MWEYPTHVQMSLSNSASSDVHSRATATLSFRFYRTDETFRYRFGGLAGDEQSNIVDAGPWTAW